jgi:hypothetical protein
MADSDKGILDETSSEISDALAAFASLTKASLAYISEIDSYILTHQREILDGGKPDADLLRKEMRRKVEGAINEE